jgi:hypothetical protein
MPGLSDRFMDLVQTKTPDHTLDLDASATTSIALGRTAGLS